MNRAEICLSAGRRLISAAPELKKQLALVGFDGFVDEIVTVVDQRRSREHFDAVQTIDALAKKIAAARGQSANYELVVQRQKLGGNGPIMADALAALGMGVTYIGNLGYPELHPVFDGLAKRATVHSIAQPAHTDALEFADGKLMLGKLSPLLDVSWKNLVARLGRPNIERLFGQSRLVAMVNWTMLPEMTRIWQKLLDEIVPMLPSRERVLFVDLADPEKRTRDDLLTALQTLSRFQNHFDVILGLNLKESDQVAEVLGLGTTTGELAEITQRSVEIRHRLSLGCVVIHPRQGAAASRDHQVASIDGPFVRQPAISTGAGDHFNAGFVAGQVLGLSLEESLVTGVGTSGYYVRSAASPDARQLAEFIGSLPAPES